MISTLGHKTLIPWKSRQQNQLTIKSANEKPPLIKGKQEIVKGMLKAKQKRTTSELIIVKGRVLSWRVLV